MAIKYVSGRTRELKVGLSSYSEGKASLQVTGNVGVGTTNPLSIANPSNTSVISAGIVTANKLYGDIVATGVGITNLNVSGVSTFVGNIFVGTGATVGFGTSAFFPDNAGIYFGDEEDLIIFHDGSHSYIDDQGTGNLKIRSNNFRVSNADESKLSATFQAAGAAELYNNNNLRLTSTADGINVVGVTSTQYLNVTGVSTFGGDLYVADNIRHTGDTDTYIEFNDDKIRLMAGGKGILLVQEATVDTLVVNDGGNNCDFRVEGLNDNSLIFSDGGTDRVGIGTSAPTAKLDVTGTVNVSGVTTFNNADVVFQGNAPAQNMTWDASENDLEFTDLSRAKFGDNDDLEIWHGSGNNSHIKNSTNDLKIRSDSLMLKRADDTEAYLKATVNQDVKLYYNGDERFATTGIGITIVGVGSTAYIEGPDNIIIDPHPYGVGTTSGSVHIKGDLYVDGTEFIIDVDKIELGDFQIGIATTAGTNVLLDGAGIGIGSTNIRKFITWNNATNALMSSENWNIASGKHYEINGVDVLTSNTLLVGTGASVHSPSNNILTLHTNGAEKLRIDATGNLGIGTVTPTDPANAANTTVTSAGIVTANQYYGTFLGSIPGFSTVFSSGQGSFSATPGSPHTIDTFAFASHDYEIAEYTLHFVHANGLQAQKTLVIQNNSTAYSNEYGILYDSELLVSIGATISGGNVNITATPELGISGVTTFRWRREVQT